MACASTQQADQSPACSAAEHDSSLAFVQANVFTPSCALSSACHQGTASVAGGLSLDDGKAYASLVGQPTTTQPGWVRVLAGDSAHSYLLVALGHVAGPLPRDGVMPLAGSPLCAEELDAIANWIDAGAQP